MQFAFNTVVGIFFGHAVYGHLGSFVKIWTLGKSCKKSYLGMWAFS
jgi:hypothetical protein